MFMYHSKKYFNITTKLGLKVSTKICTRKCSIDQIFISTMYCELSEYLRVYKKVMEVRYTFRIICHLVFFYALIKCTLRKY